MELYKAALLTTFGQASERPLRAVFVRLGSLWLTSIVLGWLIGGSMAGLALPHTNTTHLASTAAITAQVAILFVLLSAWGIIRNNTDTFGRLLEVWPISPLKRWAVLLLPGVILTILALSLISIPFGMLLLQAGIPPLVLVSASLVGVTAAYGMLYGIPRRYAWIQVGGIPIVLWAEYTASPLLLMLLLLALCILFVHGSVRSTQNNTRAQYSPTIHIAWIPPAYWFFKKLWRSSTSRLSFFTTLLLSIAIALFSRRQPGIGSYMAALFAPILAASFVADIRSLSRWSRPAEITALRGTVRFVLAYAATATVGSILAVLPLLTTAAFGSQLVLQLAAGIAAGVFAGTLIVPGPRNIMGQCTATLLCISILVLAERIPVFIQFGTIAQKLYGVGIVGLLLGAAGAIEYKRNRYIWKNHA